MSIITLLSDFGTADAYVGIMKGVILGINPAVQIVDLSHDLPPQQIVHAALVLRSAVTFFPPATIHVAVVDPGVGSVRRAILIETDAGVLIGPDNGVLGPAAAILGRRRTRMMQNAALWRQPLSHTFHGRDVFAPTAAHVSRGVALEAVGPVITDAVDLVLPAPRADARRVVGAVVYVDRFGNLLTNIAAEDVRRFPAHQVSVSIGAARVAGLVSAYAAVPEGTPLALVGSWGMLEIAVRNGSAAARFAAAPGTPVTVVSESPHA